ncbi:uncharacterized protein FIBRA_04542 [Fibroporia radiculosa]|uniref:RING-type E3 ubiquitin transferase n=1 Tax=Fibroporia radiculosa TaxID=599839 RepID=J4G7J6_9APHY|nr:uncharacterized protein FIBRA_04542 [Fibroporia radiculosa]CCM02443.1 predicted protein [Fibroporia radiculosa]
MAGYCRRGDKCWFKHASTKSPSEFISVDTAGEEGNHLCSICYEKPITYGLLDGCSHVFCLQEWRDRKGKSDDIVFSGVLKQCPLCRIQSRFVTPSSQFYPDGHPGKLATIERYKASMARVPCRFFQQSSPSNRSCPFGKDCFYQHLNQDGTPYTFSHGVEHRANSSGMWEFFDYSPDELEARSPSGVPPSRRNINTRLAFLAASLQEFLNRTANDGQVSDTDSSTPSTPEVDRSVTEAMVESLIDSFVGPFSSEDEEVTAMPDEHGISIAVSSIAQAPLDDDVTESRSLSAVVPAVDVDMTNHTPQSSGNRLSFSPHSRFSTVVPRRNLPSDELSLDDLRQVPMTVDVQQAGDIEAQSDSPDKIIAQTQEVRDSEDLLNTSVAINEGNVNRVSSQILQDQEKVVSLDVEVLQDADPPFLTDGRGRVVWSNAVSGRQRDSHRGRSRTSSGVLPQSSRVRHPAAMQADSEEHSFDFVTDGRGRVVSTGTDIVQNATPESPLGAGREVADQEERNDDCSTREDGGRSLGRISKFRVH